MMTDAEAQEVIRQLIVAEESGEYQLAPVWLGPYTAFLVVSALQLACRHPEVEPALRASLEQVGRDVQGLYAGPAGELLEAGWDPARDVPGSPR